MIKVSNIKVRVDQDDLEKALTKKLKTSIKEIKSYQIIRKSIDARDKNLVLYIYTVVVDIIKEEKYLKLKDVVKYQEERYSFKPIGTVSLDQRIVIVGSGPAGLFASYMLAKNGYKPLIIEQGSKMEERIKDVDNFLKNNKLLERSNVQFGEGGAGTFSDGKLGTMIKDREKRGMEVFDIFIKAGANSDIKYLQHPHIGTDKLREVIVNIRNEIIEMGGEFLFDSKLTNISIKNSKIESITINDKDIIKCSVLVLALGNSARDTIRMLYDKKLVFLNKPFAVGLRIMHNELDVSKSQYGSFYKYLEPATYKLTYQTKDKRGVYSFCMCPGGYVINSSSSKGRLVVNGMSNSKRDSKVSNSALVVTVNEKDYGSSLLAGISYQEKLEEACFNLRNGKIPVQKVSDFVANKLTTNLGNVHPEILGSYEFANINEILPSYISNSLKEALNNFKEKVPFFKEPDALLAGIETRTSSPIRIKRDECFEANIKGIYPAGEGAGYSGGITSSAIDGIKVAEAIMKKYKN